MSPRSSCKKGRQMVTPLIIIVSLVLLLRRFKSKRSRKIIGFLYASFAVWFVYSILTYGSYTLQPGQSVTLKVYPNTDQLEYNSELHIVVLVIDLLSIYLFHLCYGTTINFTSNSRVISPQTTSNLSWFESYA